MAKLSIRDLDLKHKRVFIRVDFNVPLDEHGRVSDVIPGSPAGKAGLVPGSTLIGVNGRRFSQRVLRNAIRDSKTASGPMQLVFSAEEFVNVVSFDYHDGARYPHLERVATVPDWLGELGKPLAKH